MLSQEQSVRRSSPRYLFGYPITTNDSSTRSIPDALCIDFRPFSLFRFILVAIGEDNSQAAAHCNLWITICIVAYVRR